MNSVSWLFEFGATFVENTVILATVTCASIRKRQTKHHLLFLFLLSVFTSLLVDAMNRISVFSYVTPIVSMTFVILISSRILSCGTLVIRSLSTILSYLIIQCIDYIVLILFGHLTGSSADFFTTFVTTVGVNRTLFITIDKLIDIIIYFFSVAFFRGSPI